MRFIAFVILLVFPLFGRLYTVCASGCDYPAANVQQAIDAASCGDVIELKAGESFGAIILRNQTCSDAYTEIRSSGVYGMPDGGPYGVRLNPQAHASLLAEVRGTGSAVYAEVSANHYRLRGLKFTSNYTNMGVVLLEPVQNVYAPVSANAWSRLIHHVTIDQCWVAGGGIGSVNRNGIRLAAMNSEILNSYVDGIDDYSESHGILCFTACTNVVLRNNYVAAHAINSLFGGAQPGIRGAMSSNVKYIGNLYSKEYDWKRKNQSSDPGGSCLSDGRDGEWVNQTASGHIWHCENQVWVDKGLGSRTLSGYAPKNLMEFKTTLDHTATGNVLKKCWFPTAGSQYCSAFLQNQVDNTDPALYAEPSTVNRGVLVRNNITKSTPMVFSNGALCRPGGIDQTLDKCYYYPSTGIRLENNVSYGVGIEPNTGATGFTGKGLQSTFMGNLTAYRNTWIFAREGLSNGGIPFSMDYGPVDQYTAVANLANQGGTSTYGGMFYDTFAGGGSLWNALDNGMTLKRNLGFNAFIAGSQNCTTYGKSCMVINLQTPSDITGLKGCATCKLYNAWTDVVTSTNDAHQLPNGGLVGQLGGYPVGANVDLVNWETAGAESGQPNPYLDFAIKQFDFDQNTASIRYVAMSAAACTVRISRTWEFSAGVVTRIDSGGDRERVMQVSGLLPKSRYWWDVSCDGGRYRQGSGLTQ